ncbi:MAG: phosphoglucosamine mutase [Candidatus Altiarchaeota archaeon]
MAKLFGTSGIRRKVEELPLKFCVNLGRAVGSYAVGDVVAVGRDTRASGPVIESAFISGVLSTGKDVVELGVVPTPTVGVATAEYGAGVMVTASHNPPDYNGFKLWNTRGALRPEEERKVEKIFYDGEYASKEGASIREEDFVEKHIQLILDTVGSADGVKVLVDCSGGAGSTVTPALLERMDCEVTSVNTNRDGVFPHGLEPTAENLAETCRLVRDGDYDIAFAHDGDADRTCAISGDGVMVEWDSFLSVLAYGLDTVVTTVDASMRVEDVANKVVRSPVGDVYVVEEIRNHNADFGGEPSGTFIFPDVHYFPDGVATAAKAAKLVAEGLFYERLSEVKSYPMTRLKIDCKNEKKGKTLMNLKRVITEDYSDIDGIRIARENAWVLLRPSGTEPYFRITAEGRNKKELDGIVSQAKNWLNEAMR